MIHNYKRFSGESDDELIYRITKDKEKIGTWQDVADILNELLGTSYSESAFRKKRQYFDTLKKVYIKNQTKSNIELFEINEKIRELEKAKVNFRDERMAWTKQNRISARVSDRLDKIEKALLSQGKTIFKPLQQHVSNKSDNDLLIILSDLHIGHCFKSYWGEYNVDIAKNRLSVYLSEILSIKELHNSQNCYISLQGDLISNSIHKTIAITNCENVINQIKIACELISSFCYSLAQVFDNVYISSVSGNHSRIDRKEDALHDERLDDLIFWGIQNNLNHIDNITCLYNQIDNGIAKITIRNKDYIAVHGDFDPFNKQGMSNLILLLRNIPYAIIYGHMHANAFTDESKVKLIRSGSFCGGGDNYTIEKRLSGEPSQMICVCTENGVKALYPIEFN